ncbi:sugar phosphate isomerase/epimerase [Myxococcota bacterium]|nr:sugar phosphate isomerase/epimerase [Myxococcota bacterium]
MGWPLGVVSVVYGGRPVREAAELARQQGFDHIDVLADDPEDLALPAGDRFAMLPRTGCTSGPARDGDRSWDKTVEDYRKVPGARIEPWPGSVVGSNERVLAFLEAVPGLRLTLDVGHVVAWGGDPMELLPFADHVQLRQACEGETQRLEGDVDLPGVLARLKTLEYPGRLSVEYFDLPDRGWGFDDPIAAACEMARRIRGLL